MLLPKNIPNKTKLTGSSIPWEPNKQTCDQYSLQIRTKQSFNFIYYIKFALQISHKAVNLAELLRAWS